MKVPVSAMTASFLVWNLMIRLVIQFFREFCHVLPAAFEKHILHSKSSVSVLIVWVFSYFFFLRLFLKKKKQFQVKFARSRLMSIHLVWNLWEMVRLIYQISRVLREESRKTINLKHFSCPKNRFSPRKKFDSFSLSMKMFFFYQNLFYHKIFNFTIGNWVWLNIIFRL